jgi:hypothetical protein
VLSMVHSLCVLCHPSPPPLPRRHPRPQGVRMLPLPVRLMYGFDLGPCMDMCVFAALPVRLCLRSGLAALSLAPVGDGGSSSCMGGSATAPIARSPVACVVPGSDLEVQIQTCRTVLLPATGKVVGMDVGLGEAWGPWVGVGREGAGLHFDARAHAWPSSGFWSTMRLTSQSSWKSTRSRSQPRPHGQPKCLRGATGSWQPMGWM